MLVYYVAKFSLAVLIPLFFALAFPILVGPAIDPSGNIQVNLGIRKTFFFFAESLVIFIIDNHIYKDTRVGAFSIIVFLFLVVVVFA